MTLSIPSFRLLFVFIMASAIGESTSWGVTLEWSRQLGTSADDEAYRLWADGLGNVYISGYTWGSLGGPSAGTRDTFLAKYDAVGTLQWNRQFGTPRGEGARSLSGDGLGNVFIAGFTSGSLDGTNAGLFDAYLRKYDAAGNLQWGRQFGTAAEEGSLGVSADGLGNVYISGYTDGSLDGTNAGLSDAYLRKYDGTGDLQWGRQFGTSGHDGLEDVSADGLGSVYVTGYTYGSLDGPNAGESDAYLRKYDDAGNIQWTRQFGTAASDGSVGVSADGLGNVFLAGYTSGNLDGPNAGLGDAYLRKYDAAGNLQWARQFGTSNYEASWAVSADGLGNVYVSGYTRGSLGGPNAGGSDSFVAMYDTAGALRWIQQLGSSADEGGYVSADGLGNVYISGFTDGSLGGPNAGGRDVWMAKFSDSGVPEPSTLLLAGFALVPVILRRRATCQRGTS